MNILCRTASYCNCAVSLHSFYNFCRKVDLAKLRILRKRLTECNMYWGQSFREKCEGEKKDFEENQIRWFIKCKYYMKKEDTCLLHIRFVGEMLAYQ